MRFLKILILLPAVLLFLTLGFCFFQPESNYQFGRLIDSLPGSRRAMANFWYARAARMGDVEALSKSGMYYLFGYGRQDKGLGIEFLKKAAEKKNVRAMSCLATAYEWGVGVEQDYGKAYKLSEEILELQKNALRTRSLIAYFHTACPPPVRDFKRGLRGYHYLLRLGEQEENPAESVGLYYYYGLGCQADRARAASYLKKAASLGSTEARAVLGAMYLRGEGVDRDLLEAAKLLKLAATCGDFDSQFLFCIASASGIQHFEDDRFFDVLSKRGFKFMDRLRDKRFESPARLKMELEKAAGKDADAATIYGLMHLHGFLVLEDEDKGKSYFRKAAGMGSVDARMIEAYESLHYPGEPSRMAEAIQTLKEGGLRGHAFAAIQYASYSASGTYSKQDWNECYSILSSHDLEHEPSSRFLLAQCYLLGLGTEFNPRKGLEMVRQSALANHPSAFIYLLDSNSHYDQKDQLELDTDSFCRKSLPLDLPRVKYRLAISLSDRDKDETLKFLKQSADGGFIEAQVELGARLHLGMLPGGIEEAVRYYRMAIENGRLDKLGECETLESRIFKRSFKRKPGSKEVLVSTSPLKRGTEFKRSRLDVVESSVEPTPDSLDGSEEALKFVLGKHCYIEKDKGEPIRIHDVGISDRDAKKLYRNRMRKIPGTP